MRDKGADIFGQARDAARRLGVTEIEAIIGSEYEALTRFANNAIHQNVAERTTHLSVRPVIDGRTARASTNRLDRDSIRDVVEQAVTMTRLMEPDADLLPLADPAQCQDGADGMSRACSGRRRASCSAPPGAVSPDQAVERQAPTPFICRLQGLRYGNEMRASMKADRG